MSAYFDIISGRQRGLVAALARGGLHVASGAYGCLLSLRNLYYDSIGRVTWLDRPCISIGNITTGGTGKTPVVIWLAGELIRSHKRVAIISRGYKGGEGGNDEFKLTSEACPQAVCIAHPDRALAGKYAIEEKNVDVILLDDGCQHRRLGRDMDIVLIDATCPFGHGHVLPRGLLREPVSALDRADIIVITRVSQINAVDLRALKAKCAELQPDALIVACDHRPITLVDLDGKHRDISDLEGTSLVAFAGVGNPAGFEKTILQLGVKPLQMLEFADHHHYSVKDCARVCEAAQRAGADLLLTTEKDLVKLRRLGFDWPVPLTALRIAIDFVGDGGKMLLQRVNDLLNEEASVNGSAPLPTG